VVLIEDAANPTGATAINKPVDGAYAPAGGISPPEASLPAGEALSPGAFTGSLPSSLAPGGELFAPQPSIATPPPTPAAAAPAGNGTFANPNQTFRGAPVRAKHRGFHLEIPFPVLLLGAITGMTYGILAVGLVLI